MIRQSKSTTGTSKATRAFMDDVFARSREHGGRATSARRAILQALVDRRGQHSSIDQLAEIVQSVHPNVATSTVYRFLAHLDELDVVDHVQSWKGPTLFVLADRHVDHLICTRCEMVIELPEGTLDGLRGIALGKFDFEVPNRHITIGGTCGECSTERH